MFIDLSIYNNDKLIAGYYNEDANTKDLRELIIDLVTEYFKLCEEAKNEHK